MDLRGVNIFLEANKLVIKKRKRVVIDDIVYSIVAPIATVMVFVIYMIIQGHMPENPGVDFYFGAIVVFLIISIGIATNIIEVTINSRDFTIEKNGDTITINSKFIFTLEEVDSVVIRGQTGSEGFGESFIVGIMMKEFYPFVFYQSENGAEYIAGKLSEFFEKKIVFKKSRGMSILKWH